MISNPQRQSFLHCLLYWEKHAPDSTWLVQPMPAGVVKEYRWRDAAAEIRRMAAHLRSLGLPPGSSIALVGKNSAHWIMADLAIMMAGHVSVPIYFTVNAETMRYVLEHSEARLVFIGKLDGKSDTWNDFRSAIPDALPKITLPLSPSLSCERWDQIISQQAPLTDAELLDPAPGELATIIYTSGSTGRPKGVMHSHHSLIMTAYHSQALFQINSSDRMLSYLPLAHAAERCMVESTSLYFGFCVYFAGNVDTFLEDLRRARPTLFFSVPRLWVKFQQGINSKLHPRVQKWLFRVPVLSTLVKRRILKMLGLHHVRAAITGSAPLPPEVLAWYRRLGLELLEGYGMTENFGYSHASRPGQTRIGYVGEPCPEVQCRIDANGEILVKSPGTMMGYFKDSRKTAEDITADGFLHTGDMGETDSQGRLRITGRIKDLFKTSKGKYVAPVPIEQLLGNHPLVEAACVTGDGLPQALGLLMLAEETRAGLANGTLQKAGVASELHALLLETNAALEAHETLTCLVVMQESWTIESGLLTPTLKIKRPEIEKRYAAKLPEWSGMGQSVVWLP